MDPSLTPDTKINLKWIRDLNLRPATIKILEENIQEKLQDTGFSTELLDMTPKAEATKSKKQTSGTT